MGFKSRIRKWSFYLNKYIPLPVDTREHQNFSSKNLLRIHGVPPVIGEVKTQLIWRKNLLVPNIRALMEVLQ
ncbi:hypothetical protein HMPREF9439_00646 [Parasutterella excrementihominis YIT 11859]|uniref:Uncharacterized protein n=1 Tax=Parasutterella excrementihominis YIT 11859 TaxID=762966 RepID=F3QI99_9BURK|nr:hypothetical protein HMPREF9439_00646 [Parasutterella excrementihominis YIT 11859]